MIGRNRGYVTTQAEIIADLFEAAGYPVISVSDSPNRYWRLIDIVKTLILKRRQVDILVINVYGGASFVVEDIASYLGRLFGKPIVMLLHGGAMPEFMARFPKWTRRVLGRAHTIVTPSEFLARAVVPYGFHARVIRNVLDLSKYQYRHRRKIEPRLLWMRTFHPIYNPLMAVRVLARLRSTVPDATLLMAGQANGTEVEVQRLADELGLNGALRLSGFLDAENKMAEANAAEIFINTNHIDNMPVSVVEACAMGLPVVSTAVGGLPDLLTDGETGLLVPDDDDEAMVEAIEMLLKDLDLTSRLSSKGRLLAERSSWDEVRPQWEHLFAELVEPIHEEIKSKPHVRHLRYRL
jgi:glycosyltransferase involved in cell wall biosynthesis